jgi:hypothetical protein
MVLDDEVTVFDMRPALVTMQSWPAWIECGYY